MTKINFSNVSSELIQLAKSSLKDNNVITQQEYDNLVNVALKDKSLNKDEQLFLSSLDNVDFTKKLLDSEFNPKTMTFNVNRRDVKNPTLNIKRDNKDTLIDVRLINKNQNLDYNLSKGNAVCEYVSTHLVSSNKFDSISNSFSSLISLPSRSLYMLYRGTEKLTPINDILNRSSKDIKNSGSDYSYVRNIANVAHKLGSGNCGENAALSAVMLANYGVSPVETFSIPGHSFTVIGRDPSSNITDPKTWGSTAVIVDPWNGIVVPVKNVINNLKDISINKEYDVAK